MATTQPVPTNNINDVKSNVTTIRPRFVLRRERERAAQQQSHATAVSNGVPASLDGYEQSQVQSQSQRWPAPRPLLRSVFFAEFDNKVGPKITYQTPKGFMSAELFDEISDFMITSPELCHKLITIHAFDLQVLGYPMYLENKKFARNAFFFNVGFSLDPSATPDQALPYHGVLCKLASYVETLEVESEFLYKEASKVRLDALLNQVFHDLNQYGECSLAANPANIINLKLSPVLPVPRLPLPHEVPVRLRSLDTFPSHTNSYSISSLLLPSSSPSSSPLVNSEWDLGVRELLPFIDGISCCARIAHQSQVSIHQVLRCVRQLLYYGCVALADIFQYTNVYVPTAHVSRLLTDTILQRAICRYCVINPSLPPPPLDLIVDLFVLQLKRAVKVSQLIPSAACDILHPAHVHVTPTPPPPSKQTMKPSSLDGNGDGEHKTVHYNSSATSTTLDPNNSDDSHGHGHAPYVQPLPPLVSTSSTTSSVPSSSTTGTGTGSASTSSTSQSGPLPSSQYTWHDWNVDLRRLLSFGVINGIIRRVHRYPIINRTSADAVPPPSVLMLHVSTNHTSLASSNTNIGNGGNDDALAMATSELERMLDGQHSFDEICSRLSMTPSQLEAWLRADNRCVIITR